MSTIFLGGSYDIEAVLRKSAKKQLDSYANEWIIVFEALQNALDAVDNVKDPVIKIVFDIGKNKVSVLDNGPGFPTEKAHFGLGSGTKYDLNEAPTRGEHGVGMKMVILCSKKFELVTRTKNGLWYACFTNGFKFLESDEEEYFDEEYTKVDRLPEGFNTLVEYTFPESDESPIRPINVQTFITDLFYLYGKAVPFDVFLKNRTKAQLFVENYFRTHSYSADVNKLFDDSHVARIEVIIKKDVRYKVEELKKVYDEPLLEYWEKENPIIFPAKYWDITEAYEEPTRKGFLTEELLKSFTGRKLGDSRIWAIKLTNIEEYKNLLINPNIKDYYNTDSFEKFLKKIKGMYIVIASASKSGKYNIQKMLLNKPDQIIAADGVVTTNQIRTPKRGKNQNYLNNIHFVINLDERVNYGKQGVKNPQLLSVVYGYFEEIYVKSLVDLAVSVAGKQSVVTELDEPDIIVTDLDDLGANLSFRKIPKHENSLIAIFFELIGQERLKGIETYHISSFDQYDGKINCWRSKSEEFRKIVRDSDLLNLEFKLTLAGLIEDIEMGNKSMKEMSLAVVWDTKIPSKVTKYNLVELEYSGYDQLRISGVNTVLNNMEGEEIPILDLSTLIKTE